MTASIRLSKPCDECGGTGWLRGGDWRTPNGGTFGHSANSRHWQPCPSCVGGWLPDDRLVDVGVAIKVEQNCGFPAVPWDVLRRQVVADLLFAARAAARYQSEEGEGE